MLTLTSKLTEVQNKLTKATEQVTTLQSEVEQLTAKLQSATTELEQLKTSNVAKTQFDELQAKLTEANSKIAEMEQKYITAEAKADEIIANQGIPPVVVPQNQRISNGSYESDLKVLQSKPYVKQSDLQAFLKKHSKEMNATANP